MKEATQIVTVQITQIFPVENEDEALICNEKVYLNDIASEIKDFYIADDVIVTDAKVFVRDYKEGEYEALVDAERKRLGE